jgi:microcompartment protein CcmL/EutN
MTGFPAIALLEFSSIAAGTFAADRMVKKAAVSLLRAGTVQPGKYLVLVAGGEAEVTLAHQAGVEAGCPQLIDDVLLPNAHRKLVDAIEGRRNAGTYDAITVLETSAIPAVVRATDAAIKGSLVELLELRLGDGLGGKGIALLTGDRADVEAAAEIAQRVLAGRPGTLCHSIVSRIDEALAGRIAKSTRFGEVDGG